jgi:pyruvate/2-oxoglutarate dehydrogenase complex dihydrolipoamide acyltransferase (E2) component
MRTRHTVVPFAQSQRQGIDWLGLMQRQHNVHALVEVDVTDARAAIRERRARTGEGLSFTAFVVACFARAIGEDPRMHALRKGRDRLVLFDDVDVTVLVESDLEAAKIPVPHIVRAANRKTPVEITREIRSAQTGSVPYASGRRWLGPWLLLPGFIREAIWARVLADPFRRRRLTGTVAVTAVGMFGRGLGWAIPLTIYPVCLTVGGIERRPVVVSVDDQSRGHIERIEPRERLALTITIDHDVINGAPAARFAVRLKDLIESAAGLREPNGSEPGPPETVREPARSPVAVGG